MRETCTAMEITEKTDRITTKKDHVEYQDSAIYYCILQPL